MLVILLCRISGCLQLRSARARKPASDMSEPDDTERLPRFAQGTAPGIRRGSPSARPDGPEAATLCVRVGPFAPAAAPAPTGPNASQFPCRQFSRPAR